MNYYTGKITANINGWGGIKIKDNSVISYLSSNKYDPLKNTGSLKVSVASGVGKGRVVTGDFNEDGVFDIKDVLSSAKNMLNKKVGNTSTHFYSVSELTLRHVIYFLKRSAN